MIEVLSVTSEIYPLIKTGGLADVTGALPEALAALAVSVRTMLPGYPSVLARLPKKAKALHSYADLFGGKARIVTGTLDGLDLIVLDAPHLFDRRGGAYGDGSGVDWPDNWRRFAAFSRAAARPRCCAIACGGFPGLSTRKRCSRQPTFSSAGTTSRPSAPPNARPPLPCARSTAWMSCPQARKSISMRPLARSCTIRSAPWSEV